jgi:hypothetical protein
MRTPKESTKRIKGTAEQVEEIINYPSLSAEGQVADLRVAVRLLARHMDLMREHFIEEEIKGIQNRGMEHDSYWRERIEMGLRIAVLEETATAEEAVGI